MKKLMTMLLLSTFLYSFSFKPEDGSLTKSDRKEINNYLKKTRTSLIKKIESLTDDQWRYKPNPETWSPAEIAEHILKAEAVVLKRVEGIVEKEYKPDQMLGSKEKAEEMIEFIVSRREKFKAPEPVSPSGSFESPEAFIEAFTQRRKETYEYVKSVKRPLKAYYENFGPIGEVNGYHWLLFISAHTERHVKQLDEVLEHSQFPG